MEKREQVGEGNDKKVFADIQNPEEKVSVEFREKLSDDQIKSSYYFNKIAHLLFPENIPDVHIAGNQNGVSYIKAERFPHDEEHSYGQQLGIKHSAYYLEGSGEKPSREEEDRVDNDIANKSIDPRVQELVDAMRESGLAADSGGQNYSFGPDGSVKYLELNPGWYYFNEEIKPRFNVRKLKTAIEKLSLDKRKEAQQYFDRLMFLYERNVKMGDFEN
jgi:hypothetical protein